MLYLLKLKFMRIEECGPKSSICLIWLVSWSTIFTRNFGRNSCKPSVLALKWANMPHFGLKTVYFTSFSPILGGYWVDLDSYRWLVDDLAVVKVASCGSLLIDLVYVFHHNPIIYFWTIYFDPNKKDWWIIFFFNLIRYNLFSFYYSLTPKKKRWWLFSNLIRRYLRSTRVWRFLFHPKLSHA